MVDDDAHLLWNGEEEMQNERTLFCMPDLDCHSQILVMFLTVRFGLEPLKKVDFF